MCLRDCEPELEVDTNLRLFWKPSDSVGFGCYCSDTDFTVCSNRHTSDISYTVVEPDDFVVRVVGRTQTHLLC
jgi:hypothetical protein